MKKITFAELKQLNGKSIDLIHAIEEPYEPIKGIITINGATVFNCHRNDVLCDNDSYAIIYFYDKRGKDVANISVFSKECLVIIDSNDIYSETAVRVLNDKKLFYV